MDIRWPLDTRADFAFGIVVTSDQADGNASSAQLAKLIGGPEASVHVLPLIIEQVTRDDDKRNSFVDRDLYQVFEGFACGISKSFCRHAGIRLEATQRTVDVDIGCVYETKTVSGIVPSSCADSAIANIPLNLLVQLMMLEKFYRMD